MRSLLFVPADSERKIAKALSAGADALILDLEDSVAPNRRPQARKLASEFIRATLAQPQRPKLYLRINPIDGGDAEADIAEVVPAGPDGIVQPKPNSGHDVQRLSIALSHIEERNGRGEHPTRILPIVTETPASVLQLSTYIGASSRTVGMSWGAEDLSAVVGSLYSRTPAGALTSPYRLARDLCLLTAAAADVQPIDTVFVNFRDTAGLRQEALEAARDGFTGKIAIHPDQVGPINEIFTPSAEEIAHADAVARVFASNPEAGVASLNGVMLDRPHLKLAQKVLARAKSAGVASSVATPLPPSRE
ncbi:MAG: CoA ester lyase [Hyphomicrobiaceae bacterium]|jgi:citrate lyase subunit beta/citryl-CoA lyase